MAQSRRAAWLAALLLLAGLAGRGAVAETVSLPGPEGVVLQAQLFRPDTPKPDAAAIVALHGCGGPYPTRDAQWRNRLLADGHVMLFPDSFGSRGLRSQCRETQRTVLPNGLRRLDAIAAAEWLAAQPGVPRGIVLLGWSDGGSTTVAVSRAAPDLPPGLFRGFVAFYPSCRVMLRRDYRPAAPILMLHGEMDDWTPFAPCHDAVTHVASPLVVQQAYPGAYHDFDAPSPLRVMSNIPSSQNADKTVHAGEDPAARDDALVRVPAYIASLPAR
jgi:dienelactone hydrolase